MDYAEIAKEIVKDHTTYGDKQSYDPIYWDRGYSETDEEALTDYISGSTTDDDNFPRWREISYDRLEDWVSESVWMDAKELTDQYLKYNEVPQNFDEYELRDEIQAALYDACTQDYAKEWITNMEDPVVRVMLTDEDHPDSWVSDDADWTAERLATNAGIEHSEKNLKACQVILDNAYYPGTVKMLFLVFRLDLSSIPDDPSDKVRIHGEVELWATNPFTGDGMADTVDVDITVERNKLATDKNAVGYSYDEVFGPVKSMIPMPELEFCPKELV